MGIEINSSRVYPVRAFGRTFVFWTEVEQKKPDGQTSTTLQVKTKGDVQEVSGPQQVEYRLKVMYSFCDLSDHWTPPQILTYGPTETGPIQDAHIRVSRVGADEDEAIVVDFHCNLAPVELSLLALGLSPAFFPLLMGLPPRVRAKRLTADLTVSDIAAVPVLDARADILAGLFNSAESNNLDLNAVIAIDSADRRDDAPWYSLDIKGGSFLARPVESRSSGEPEAPLLALANNADGLPRWNRIDACLDGSDGHQYLFNNERLVYAIRGDSNEFRIDARWACVIRRCMAMARWMPHGSGEGYTSSSAATGT